ncbi:MAG: UTP--glucose-1-phosphate uridylyltransferase [Phycisphaerales bacterium]|nr:MAG: UTP--glucose-1-phosphate uridylyltransferase [Phycisphaerales bacterium]
MRIQKTLENLRSRLQEHGQSHLLRFWEHLDEGQKQALLEQIQRLDLPKIDQWVADSMAEAPHASMRADFSPAPFYSARPSGTEWRSKYAEAVKLGRKTISAGKVAAFVVAGGQGTRLGLDGPKGDFPISPVKNRTLFQIFADAIRATCQEYQAVCPWYVMTSPLNYSRTVEVFRSSDYYGLDPGNVFIFQQGTLPNFSSQGRILLADKANIVCSPDGHGGSLKALHQSGSLKDMKKRGVEFLSYWQVDNPLINIFDPLFIGLHILDRAEMSSKAVRKAGPGEKVGNFCLIDGKITVIEYSDLPDKLAQKRQADGSLVFQLGSIGIHIINRTFVEKLNTRDFSLPLHRAVKAIPRIDEQGNLVESDGIKLESFVFDAIPMASRSMILETLRSEEFAPTKNTTGVDSVETTRRMMVARAAAWLESAGVAVPRKPDGSVDCLIEIAPSFALDKEDIKAKRDQIPRIRPGETVYLA